MRHIGKESTLRPVCCLCSMHSLRKCLIHFPVSSTIRHNQDIFLFPVYFTAHCNIMEPAFFPCLQMNIFKVSFSLFMDLDFLQIIFLWSSLFCHMQFSYNPDIFTNLFYRYSQQFFHIRTNVICMVCFCIQHQENVIHIH